jgi:hypothetical protein
VDPGKLSGNFTLKINKMEREKIIPYLPYNLQLWHIKNKCAYPLVVGNTSISLRGGLRIDEYESEGCKPILRPISDLDGEYLSNSNLDLLDQIKLDDLRDKSILFCNLEYHLACHLFKNHFDVFGLIEEGEAIDINTLNP